MSDLDTPARGAATGTGDRSRPHAVLPAFCVTQIVERGGSTRQEQGRWGRRQRSRCRTATRHRQLATPWKSALCEVGSRRAYAASLASWPRPWAPARTARSWAADISTHGLDISEPETVRGLAVGYRLRTVGWYLCGLPARRPPLRPDPGPHPRPVRASRRSPAPRALNPEVTARCRRRPCRRSCRSPRPDGRPPRRRGCSGSRPAGDAACPCPPARWPRAGSRRGARGPGR